MRELLEAILAFSNHFGGTLALDLDDPKMIAELLDKDQDSEFFEEIMKNLETLRHQIGALASPARSTRDMIRYGEEHWNNQRDPGDSNE